MTAVYIQHGGRLLLLYRGGSRVVAPSWCGIGGHFEPDELNDARAAILRELEEEAGLAGDDITGLTLRYITLRLKNGEVRQNYYFFAQLCNGGRVPTECGEGKLAWMEMDQLPFEEMPYTAKHMLQHYVAQGRHTQLLYGGMAQGVGVVFKALEEF